MSNSRRDFLKKGALLSLSGIAGSALGNENMQKLDVLAALGADADNKYTLPVLPYGYDALEPFIDQQTMVIHHSRHHQAYVDNLNKALAEYKGTDIKSPGSLESILSVTSKLPAAIRNNAGGHYNHTLFWTLMKPNKDNAANKPSGKLAEGINASFGSFEEFQKTFNEAAAKRFGSGWAWLYAESGKLKIGSTPNQDNPLMDLSDIKGKPVLALDVWEHAYYLKYQNKRVDYVNNWWSLINWETAAKLYQQA